MAACAPTEDGMNANAIVHEPLTGIAELHVGSEKLNSFPFAPPSTTLEMCSGAVPVLFTVTFIGVLVPCVAVPKSGLLGFTATADEGGAVAFPTTFMTCGELGASSVSATLAVRNPGASGLNVTVTMQEALIAMALQAGSEKLKSPAFAPPIATFVICSTAVPPLVTVTFIGVLLVPCVTVPKSRLPGTSVTAGAGARPVPDRLSVCGLPEALSVT